MVSQPATGQHLFSSGSRFSPSSFRVACRTHESAFTVMHDLSATSSVWSSPFLRWTLRWRLMSHGFVVGHGTPGLHVVGPGLFRFFFFEFFFSFFGIGFLGFLGGLKWENKMYKLKRSLLRWVSPTHHKHESSYKKVFFTS